RLSVPPRRAPARAPTRASWRPGPAPGGSSVTGFRVRALRSSARESRVGIGLATVVRSGKAGRGTFVGPAPGRPGVRFRMETGKNGLGEGRQRVLDGQLPG